MNLITYADNYINTKVFIKDYRKRIRNIHNNICNSKIILNSTHIKCMGHVVKLRSTHLSVIATAAGSNL